MKEIPCSVSLEVNEVTLSYEYLTHITLLYEYLLFFFAEIQKNICSTGVQLLVLSSEKYLTDFPGGKNRVEKN